jgi:hypothetical protein
MKLRGRYDPIEHRYYLGDEELPSVTQILVRAGRINASNFTPEAADRGRLVHRVAELIDYQQAGRPTVGASWAGRIAQWTAEHPALTGYAEAYRAFAHDFRPDYYAIEQPRFSARYRFAGRPDRQARRLQHQRGRAIVEMKSGGHLPWHALQTAGYQMLKATGARFLLYLQPGGRYRFQRVTDITDYMDFRRDLAAVWKQIEQERRHTTRRD